MMLGLLVHHPCFAFVQFGRQPAPGLRFGVIRYQAAYEVPGTVLIVGVFTLFVTGARKTFDDR